MELLWYIIIAIVLAMFFILDGYDFGTGIIHLFFAKKEEDKIFDENQAYRLCNGSHLYESRQFDLSDSGEVVWLGMCKALEVVGNIYENHDLL